LNLQSTACKAGATVSAGPHAAVRADRGKQYERCYGRWKGFGRFCWRLPRLRSPREWVRRCAVWRLSRRAPRRVLPHGPWARPPSVPSLVLSSDLVAPPCAQDALGSAIAASGCVTPLERPLRRVTRLTSFVARGGRRRPSGRWAQCGLARQLGAVVAILGEAPIRSCPQRDLRPPGLSAPQPCDNHQREPRIC
jgi:hypothetical protein